MEAAIEFLRSNYVYTQIFSSIAKSFAHIDSWDFLSVGKRQICLLARNESACWQEADLPAGKRQMCLLAETDQSVGKGSVCLQETDLSVGKK